jgi:cAMP-dependent protein kinase regulator
MSLPASYQNEVNALNREILKEQPKDILQYCANFFNRRLESQRTEFLLQQGQSGGKEGGKMAASTFQGSNPFGQQINSFSSNRGVQSITEEDEENDTVGSPTDATFKGARSGQSGSASSPFANSSPFGASSGGGGGGLFRGPFGGGDSNGNVPDESASGPPSSFRGGAGGGDSLPANYATGRRVSVSAESMNPNADSGDWKPPSHPKSPEQTQRLKTAVSNNFLFSNLDDDSFHTILNALQEKPIPAANIKIISQGDSGDFFYIVEKGEFDVYIHPSGSVQPGPEGMGKKVATIGPGGGFGELALMYDAPRNATIVSVSKGGLLWQLDRTTFRRILMDSSFQRRKMYEGFLEEVPLLSTLKGPERAKIADALGSQKYPAGTHIIKEGDPGDAFYLLESGEAEAYKAGVEKPVKHYERGAFFGELALLDDKPRQASVVAKTEVKLARLDRAGFKRLLGPVEGMMRREQYTNADDVDPLSRMKTVT